MHLVDTVTNLINRAERALMGDDERYVLSNFERAVQLDDYSCGSKASYMILRHFRRARSSAAVARLVGTDEDGTAAGPILRGFRARGLRARINAAAAMSDLERAIRGE